MTDQLENEITEEEFPSNSKKHRVVVSKPRVATRVEGTPIKRKKLKKIVQGRVAVKKKSFLQKLGDSFLSEDSKSVGHYILYDVLIPAAKSTIQEMVASGIEMLLFGETGTRRRSGRDSSGGRSIVSYGSYYNRRDDDVRYNRLSRRPGHFDLDTILFQRGDEAAEVLENLCNLLDKYNQVTVADFYDLAGVEGGTWVDQKWGWENLSEAFCRRVRGGYIIKFPEPMELD